MSLEWQKINLKTVWDQYTANMSVWEAQNLNQKHPSVSFPSWEIWSHTSSRFTNSSTPYIGDTRLIFSFCNRFGYDSNWQWQGTPVNTRKIKFLHSLFNCRASYTKINLPPRYFTQRKCLIISESCSENLNPVRCQQGLYVGLLCSMALEQRMRAWSLSPSYLRSLLSWQNPITTLCSNNRPQIRGKEERIIIIKCHGGNLFLSTQHSRGQPQKTFPGICVCGCVCPPTQWQWKIQFFICFPQLPLVTLTAAEKHQKYSPIREVYKRRVNFNHLRTCVVAILSCSPGRGS